MKDPDQIPLDARRAEPAGAAAAGGADGGLRLTRRERPQTALAVKALLRDDRDAEDPFAEIKALCDTAGATVVETMSQNLERLQAGTYLGKGKIQDIAARVQELDVDLVVADNDLSPAQHRNLETLLDRPVIDRTQLILDIFALRASTLQAKLQVETAQLRYTLPRLKRMWTHLSRYEGGIGMRGPGETQLETDKRLIQRRLRILQGKLDSIEARAERATARETRDLVIALVGYTNVGKSSLLNRLTGSQEFVEDKLFATLDTRTRKWPIDERRHVLLKDTVGFIRALPHHLVASFHATLAETQQADLLFHVVDASSPDARAQVRAVNEVLQQIDCGEKPTWMVLNKWDRLSADRRVEARDLAGGLPAGTPVFAVSAASGEGLEELRRAVVEHIDRRSRRAAAVLPHGRGDLIAFVHRHGRVIEEKFHDDGVHLRFEMPTAPLEKLRSMGVEAVEAAEAAKAPDGGT
jgi:GTP-binding protein HflX